jgi:hypothetical protein
MQQKYMMFPTVGFVLLTIEEFVNFLPLQQWDKLEDSMDIHEQWPTKINSQSIFLLSPFLYSFLLSPNEKLK